MAEKPDKKAEAAPPAAPAPAKTKSPHKGGGLMSKTPVLIGGVMLLEAVVLFAGFKFLGAGASQASAGAEIAEEHGAEGGEHGEGQVLAPSDPKASVEVPVLDFKAPNKQSGRTFLYDVSIYAVTTNEHGEKLKEMIKAREALIKDRFRTIIAQSDPEKLGGGSEPGLETLRRQVKYQLDEIVGEGVVAEVLVPRCIPFRADY